MRYAPLRPIEKAELLLIDGALEITERTEDRIRALCRGHRIGWDRVRGYRCTCARAASSRAWCVHVLALQLAAPEEAACASS